MNPSAINKMDLMIADGSISYTVLIVSMSWWGPIYYFVYYIHLHLTYSCN